MEMQAPNTPKVANVTQDDLKRLITELGPLKQALGTGGQGSQWQRGVKESDRRAYQAKLAEIQQRLNADIDRVGANLDQHAPYIQSLVNTAKAEMNLVKKAVEAYEKRQDDESLDQAVRITAEVADRLEAIAAAATEADQAYGAAWFEYRGALPDLPEGVSADYFESKRKELMTRGKAVTAKAEKLRQLTIQAKAYDELSRKLKAGGKAKKEERKRAALALEAKLQDLLDSGIEKRNRNAWDGDGRNLRSKVRALETIAKNPITKKTQEEAASWLADLEATVKAYRNQVKTMDTVLETGLKPLSPKHLKANKKIYDLAAAHVRRAHDIQEEAELLVKAGREKMKIIKRAQV
jgi:hypothetical protein